MRRRAVDHVQRVHGLSQRRACRLLHAIGMLRANAPLRGLGMIFTYLALVAAVVSPVVV